MVLFNVSCRRSHNSHNICAFFPDYFIDERKEAYDRAYEKYKNEDPTKSDYYQLIKKMQIESLERIKNIDGQFLIVITNNDYLNFKGIDKNGNEFIIRKPVCYNPFTSGYDYYADYYYHRSYIDDNYDPASADYNYHNYDSYDSYYNAYINYTNILNCEVQKGWSKEEKEAYDRAYEKYKNEDPTKTAFYQYYKQKINQDLEDLKKKDDLYLLIHQNDKFIGYKGIDKNGKEFVIKEQPCHDFFISDGKNIYTPDGKKIKAVNK